MDRALQKLAGQLNQFDAASLMSLWDGYVQRVSRFEPSKRWEEAALVLCMIQAVHWKNQLFNTHMLAGRARAEEGRDRQLRDRLRKYPQMPEQVKTEQVPGVENGGPGLETKKKRTILTFKPRGANKR